MEVKIWERDPSKSTQGIGEECIAQQDGQQDKSQQNQRSQGTNTFSLKPKSIASYFEEAEVTGEQGEDVQIDIEERKT